MDKYCAHRAPLLLFSSLPHYRGNCGLPTTDCLGCEKEARYDFTSLGSHSSQSFQSWSQSELPGAHQAFVQRRSSVASGLQGKGSWGNFRRTPKSSWLFSLSCSQLWNFRKIPKFSWLFSLTCSQLWVCSMWVDKKLMNDIAVVITYQFQDDEEGGLKGPESFANNSGHYRQYLVASLHPQTGDCLVGWHTCSVPSPPAHSDS